MGSWIWWTILGMAIVTYIPRAIPLTFLEGRELPPVVQNVLRNIPFAVLGALIFPAIFFIQENINSPSGTNAQMVITLWANVEFFFQFRAV